MICLELRGEVKMIWQVTNKKLQKNLKQRRQNKLPILRDTNFDILIVIQVIDAYKSKDIQDHQLLHEMCIIFYCLDHLISSRYFQYPILKKECEKTIWIEDHINKELKAVIILKILIGK